MYVMRAEYIIAIMFFFVRWSLLMCFFFFSSRRRHTRWTGDWSSDVCSSDLSSWFARSGVCSTAGGRRSRSCGATSRSCSRAARTPSSSTTVREGGGSPSVGRSEERRVGKECRCGGWRDDEKKKRSDEGGRVE